MKVPDFPIPEVVPGSWAKLAEEPIRPTFGQVVDEVPDESYLVGRSNVLLPSEILSAGTESFNARERKRFFGAQRKGPKPGVKEVTAMLKKAGWKIGDQNDPKFLRWRLQRDCLKSLAAFTKAFWPVIEPATPLVWNWHLDVMCEALEAVYRGDILRLLINVPPGHMKSILVNVMWPAWIWFQDPTWRSIFTTYDKKLMERDGRKCRDVIESTKYRETLPALYGEQWKEKKGRAWELKPDAQAVSMYMTEYQGMRLATTIGGAGTGHRGDCLVIDDPMNVEEFPTEESLQSVISWYDGRMSSRFNDMSKGRIVCIMQRLHENDLAGHILAQDEVQKDNPNWKPFTHICFPSEYDQEKAERNGWNKFDRRTEDGQLLFEARFDRPVLEEAKIKLGPAGYGAQHDQDPTPAGGGIFECWKLHYWFPRSMIGKPPPPVLEKDDNGDMVVCHQAPLPERFDLYCQSWDCAFKDKEDSDYVSGQLWARKFVDAYLLTQVYGHLSFKKTCAELVKLTNAYPMAVAKYVEDKANGSAVIDHLSEIVPGLIPVEPEGGKLARGHAVSPFVSAGNVWLPHPDVFPLITKPLLVEMRAFPRGKHDDQVDALTQALIKLILKGMSYLHGMTKR